VDLWNCVSDFWELFGQGCSLAEAGGKGRAGWEKGRACSEGT